MLACPRLPTRAVVSLVALSLIVAYSQISIWAGHRNFRNAGVGGISIDAEGVLRQADPASKKMILNELRKDIQQAPMALLAPNGMRMVSLRGLQDAIRDAQENNLGRLPEEVRFLAGLQRIQYVLVYPEGTTSAGLTVLPFHGLLLKAAPESRTPVQPITIAYRREGRPDHLAPFIEDDEFHHHLLRMLAQPSARVDVVFHEPLHPSEKIPAGEFAASLRETVLEGLTRIYRGEYDRPATECLRTGDDPGLPHLPSLHGGQRSPDQSTG